MADNLPTQDRWKENAFPGYKQQGPPTKWQQYIQSRGTSGFSKQSGIDAIKRWRDEQIAKGYTFRTPETPEGMRHQATPWKKNWWVSERNGEYSGYNEYMADIANKLENDELPKGAIAFLPDGRPYYGGKNDYQEWQLRNRALLKDGSTTTEQEASFSDWNAPSLAEGWRTGGILGLGKSVLAGAMEGVEQLNEAIDFRLQGGTETDTPTSVQNLYRHAMYNIKSPIMWAFELGKDTQKLIGGVMNAGHYLEGKPTYSEFDAIEAKRLKDIDDPDWYTKAIKWQDNRTPSWANIKAEFWEGFDNSGWLYSAMWDNFKGDPRKLDIGNPFDPVGTGSLKLENMKRQLKNDPSLNPYMVASQYENIWVQMIGESILDPLNLVGMAAKPITAGVRMKNVLKRYGKYGDEIMEVIGRSGKDAKLTGLAEEVASKLHMDEFVKARGRQLERIQDATQQWADSKGLFTATNGAKAHEVATDFGQVDLWMKAASVGEGGWDPDQYMEIYDLVRRSASKNADEAAEAMASLSKIEGWDIILTDGGARASQLMDDMGEIKKIRQAILDGSDNMWDLMDEAVEATAQKWFPTLSEQLKKNPKALGPGWKAIAAFHEATRPLYNAINGVFSIGYLGVNPGYASRNLIQNNVQTWFDLGFTSVLDPKNWFGSEELVKKWAGVMNVDTLIPGMKTGISGAKDLAGDTKGLLSMLSRKAPATRMANAFEDLSAVKIYGKVYPETMRKILNKSNIVDDLIKHGIDPKIADDTFKRLMRNGGDVRTTMNEIMTAAQKGYLRQVETDLGLNANMVRFLDETGLYDRYHSIMRTSTTKESAKKAWNDLWDEYMGWAEDAVKKEVPTAPNDPVGITDVLLAAQADAPADVTRRLANHVTANIEAEFEYKVAYDNMINGYGDVLAGSNKGFNNTTGKKQVMQWADEIKIDVGGSEVSLTDAIQKDILLHNSKREAQRVYDKWDDLRNNFADLYRDKDWQGVRELWESTGLQALHGDFGDKRKLEDVIDKAWRAWEVDNRAVWSAGRDDLQSAVRYGLDKIKLKVEATLGKELPNYGQQFIKADKLMARARKFDTFLHSNAVARELRTAMKRKDMKGALYAWARQYRIRNNVVKGGKPSLLEPFGKKLEDVSSMSGDEIDELTNLLIKAGKQDIAVDLRKKYYAYKSVTPENVEDIFTQSISSASIQSETARRQAAQAQKVFEQLNAAADRVRVEVGQLSDKVRLETGGNILSLDDYMVNIVNSQLGRSFKSIDEMTVDALTWKEAESALLAHALDEKVRVFSDPEYGLGLVKRMVIGNLDDFSDEQLARIDDFFELMKIERPDDVKRIYEVKGEWEELFRAKQAARDSADVDFIQEKMDELEEELTKALDDYGKVLKDREPEELGRLVQKYSTDPIPETGDFTTWAGEAAPSRQRAIWDARVNLKKQHEDLAKHIDTAWDNKIEFKANKSEIARFEKAAKQMEEKVAFARRISAEVSRATRNFILHDYKAKKNIDLVLGYLMPYSFWYSRTYSKWLARIPSQAGTISAYARFKRELGKIHHDMPDWWKYQINTNELLGIESENPLFFNLEAVLNPLNGITGIDFNDPSKRTNWFTSVVDQIGKFGPSVYTPITMAIAYSFWAKGENEMAEKWAGRLIPQSAGIKALTAMLGAKGGRGVEIDPHVRLMGKDNLDYFERRRVGRQLGIAVQEGLITQEQALEAARTMTGPVWNNAVATAQSHRSLGNLSGMMFGVGFKARNKGDLLIDQMDEQFSRFMAMKDDLSPEEVKTGFDWFRYKYPFFDTVKLSRQATDERDTGYAYNVLGRVPPAMSGDAYSAVGITYEMTKAFYENKGMPSTWSDKDKAIFMDGIIQLGAVLAMPADATRAEWREVQRRDKEMYVVMEQKYGEHIRDAESYYWDLYWGEGGREAAKAWIADNPDVQEYMNEKISYRMNDPLLAKYYSSYDKARSLLFSRREIELQTRFPGIQPLIDEYYQVKLEGGPKAGDAFLKEHPEIEEYWDAKAITEQRTNETLLRYETFLPEGEEIAQPVIRQDTEFDTEQQDLLEKLIQEDSRPEYLSYSYQEWMQQLNNPALERRIEDWLRGDEFLSRSAESALEHAIKDMDITLEMAKLLIFRAGRGYGPTGNGQ